LFKLNNSRILVLIVIGRGVPVLNWPARVKIAAGSARGLAYLHEDCNGTFHFFTFIHEINDIFSLHNYFSCQATRE
jgi:hypothetical protein